MTEKSVSPSASADPSGRSKLVPASGGRIPQLDGLRGWAILLVISLHFIADAGGGDFGTFLYRFKAAFRLGWAGVDLFFVLSGFLIAGILLEKRETQNYFSVFYIRRAFRIIPIYYVWTILLILVTAAGGAWLSRFWDLGKPGLTLLPYYFSFLQNYVGMPFGTLAWAWLAPAWSLGVEEQFYLLVPLLVRYLSASKLKALLLTTILLGPLFRLLVLLKAPGAGGVYTWLPCRADSLAFGALAAVAWREGIVQRWYARHSRTFLIVLLLLLIPVPIAIKWFPNPYSLVTATIGYSWLACLFSCLLLYSLLEPQGRWASFLKLRIFREMGKVSYCVYLIHLAILQGLSHILLRSGPRLSDFRGVAVVVLAFVVTIALANLSWKFFELPLIRRGHTFEYKA